MLIAMMAMKNEMISANELGTLKRLKPSVSSMTRHLAVSELSQRCAV